MQLEPIASSRARPGRWSQAWAFVVLSALAALPASAQTLDRITQSGSIRLGYLVDALPFTARTEAGDVEGYGAALCAHIAEQVRTELELGELRVEWVPVTVDDRESAVRDGRVDLLCSPMNVTLTRRSAVSFSIPVFLGGTSAVLRETAPAQLRNVLSGAQPIRPVWRGSPAKTLLQRQRFAVVSGTTTESWIAERRSTFHIDAEVLKVPDFPTALEALADGRVDVVFGERALIVEAMHELGRRDFTMLDRLFTHEQAGLALPRDDSDFRSVVDAALSRLYRTEAFAELYIRWFGDMSETTRTFFDQNALPE